MAFAPSGIIGVLILALAAVIAIAVHEILVRLLRRAFGDRQPYLRSLLRAISGLTRLAFLIRERFRLRGQVKAASAHGRLTSMVLTTETAIVEKPAEAADDHGHGHHHH